MATLSVLSEKKANSVVMNFTTCTAWAFHIRMEDEYLKRLIRIYNWE